MSNNANFLRQLADNIQNLASESGEIVVLDGQRIGPGHGVSDNMVSGISVSKTYEDAESQRRYEDSKLGKLDQDLTDEQIDAVVDKYINEIVDGLFKGV